MHVWERIPLKELEQMERVERDAWRAKRLRIIILALKGYTAPAVAMSVGLTRRVCQEWVCRFNKYGLEGLDDERHSGRQPPLTPEQEESFRQRIEQGPTSEDTVCSLRGAELQRILQEEFGVCRCLASIYFLLHRLGYSYLQPRPRHYKADSQAQEEFQQQLPQRLIEIAKAHPDQQVRVYFQDEARFGQQGTLTRVWARRGTRPTAVRQTEYDYLWVLGVVCPETGKAEGLLSPRLNTDVVNIFLREFAGTLPANEHAVLLWDGAGYHTSKKMTMPANITVLRLPPYSPELNPIENLWHYLKSHYWSNRTYAGYEELEMAAIDAWKSAALKPELMKSVCATTYLKRAISN